MLSPENLSPSNNDSWLTYGSPIVIETQSVDYSERIEELKNTKAVLETRLEALTCRYEAHQLAFSSLNKSVDGHLFERLQAWDSEDAELYGRITRIKHALDETRRELEVLVPTHLVYGEFVDY